MAATVLYYAKTGVMVENSYADFRDKAMDVFLERSAKVPLEGLQFFNKETANTLAFKGTTWSNVLNHPRRLSDTDPRSYDQPAPGYDFSGDIITYSNAVALTDTIVKTDISGGKVRSMMSGLPDSGRSFIEYGCADVINNATTTAGSDGSYGFASDHYHEDARAGTWSNTESSGALTSTTFDTMRLNMKKRKNEKGFPMGINLVSLVVPLDKETKAREISGSDKIPETSTNAVNVWKGVNVIPWRYLTSTTAWYGWGDLPPAMWGLHYVVLTEPTVSKLAFPSAAYPHVQAGWEIYMQVDWVMSQLKNMHYNAGV